MADRTVTIKRYNNSVWDNVYPKTTIAQVINLSSTLANMQSEIDQKGKWQEIYAGTSSALSETGTTAIAVPSNVYAGKTIAVEIRYGSSSNTSYTNRIVFVTLGTNSTSGGSSTYPRYISFSEWDGTYLKIVSTKCYVTTTGTETSIYFGYLKTLIGYFSGTTINWNTEASTNLNVYIGKIWLVG